MRVAELLHREVVDADGVPVGKVDDVRLIQDGPYLEGFGAALRLDGLVVGRGALGLRLGYLRHGVRGPWLLATVFGRLERRARFVPWSAVVDGAGGGGVVRLGCRADELRGLPDL